MQRTLVTVPPAISMVALIGTHDDNLRIVEAAFPSVAITVRGNEITLRGPHAECGQVEKLFAELLVVIRSGQALTTDAVSRSIAMLSQEPQEHPAEVLSLNIVSNRGRTIRPKTANQKRYVEAIEENTITFGIGPAGTGKTYLAMAKQFLRFKIKK
jgi:phosphate starvation-inducible PhoH-like protein